jgi:hypothetical protein
MMEKSKIKNSKEMIDIKKIKIIDKIIFLKKFFINNIIFYLIIF